MWGSHASGNMADSVSRNDGDPSGDSSNDAVRDT